MTRISQPVKLYSTEPRFLIPSHLSADPADLLLLHPTVLPQAQDGQGWQEGQGHRGPQVCPTAGLRLQREGTKT